MDKLALDIHSWQVNANIFKIFKVMRNAFVRDFYFSLESTVQQRTKKPTHVQYCRTDTDRYLQFTIRKFRTDRHPCLQTVNYDSRSVCRGINILYKYD